MDNLPDGCTLADIDPPATGCVNGCDRPAVDDYQQCAWCREHVARTKIHKLIMRLIKTQSMLSNRRDSQTGSALDLDAIENLVDELESEVK